MICPHCGSDVPATTYCLSCEKPLGLSGSTQKKSEKKKKHKQVKLSGGGMGLTGLGG